VRKKQGLLYLQVAMGVAFRMLQYFAYTVTNENILLLKVLNIITEEVLMHDGSFKSVTDQCDFIKQSFSSKKC